MEILKCKIGISQEQSRNISNIEMWKCGNIEMKNSKYRNVSQNIKTSKYGIMKQKCWNIETLKCQNMEISKSTCWNMEISKWKSKTYWQKNVGQSKRKSWSTETQRRNIETLKQKKLKYQTLKTSLQDHFTSMILFLME